MSNDVSIRIPPKLIPVFTATEVNGLPVRYRGAYGGRGSAKTRTFAIMAAVRALMHAAAGDRGLIVCGREFMNSLDESSFAEVKEAIISVPWLLSAFDVGEKYIRTRCRRVSFAFIGLRHNLDSIKSKARILVLWVDEAEPVSAKAWMKVTPTVREHNSEIWVTWNPERKISATHKRFREKPPRNAIIVEMNYSDNPWFPAVLEQERLDDLENRPEQYGHIWEGEFVTVAEGAYFAEGLAKAKLQGRIARIAEDPLMIIRIFCDIGGTGARSDAFTMWAMQFIGHEIRVLNYYESVGQPIGAHLNWLRGEGYDTDRAKIWLPHDGDTNDKVHDVSYASAFKSAGYKVEVVPNQGKGAAAARIEAVRRLLPACWFNEDTTEGGRTALGWYHEKKDEERDIGLGPNHDWSSHGSDSFGLGCIVYKPPSGPKPRVKVRPIRNHMGM